MVNSRLNSKINYIENKTIDTNDQGLDADLWGLEINGKNIDVIVGNLNFSHKDKDVIYLNIYVVLNDEVHSKIGVYEITTSELPLIEENINEDTLDLSMLGEPLFFSFVDNDFLENYYSEVSPESSPIEEPKHTEEEEIETEKQVEKESEKESEAEEEESEAEEEESQEDTLSELSKDSQEDEVWINQYLNKTNYNIVDNEGGGDCLFAVIRDAFKGLHKNPLSIKKIRKLLASKVTEELFKNYYELFTDFDKENKLIKNSIYQLKEDFKKISEKFKTSSDIEQQKDYSLQLDKLKEKISDKNVELDLNKTLLNEYRFMKGVTSIDELKEKIKTCDFWAETWAISTLEDALNIKLIILSSENYHYGDSDSVLLCGQLNDERKGIFKPSHYILVDYNGYHYQLITYNNKRVFDYDTLPLQIKKLIVNKCLEKQAGIYSFIPEFNKLKEDLSELKKQKMSLEKKQELQSIKNTIEKGEKQKTLHYNEPEETIFQFYFRSADKKPGKGVGEKIKPENIGKYSKLSSIKDWRKKLSNMDVSPFKLDDLQWNSVEHFHQASKFKKNHPEFYYLFSIDSESEISKDPKIAKGAGGETGKFSGKQYRDKSIIVDEDFFTSGRSEKELERAMYAKFNQNEESKRVLLETKDAKLQEFIKGSEPIVSYNLMNVRRQLREGN